MLDRLLEALTGRRLGGALFVLCGLIVVAIVLWPGDDGGDEPRKTRIQPARLVSVPELGLAFAHPRAWSRTVAGRVIRLRSPDRTTTLTFASPIRGRHAQQVKGDLKEALRKGLRRVKVVRDGPSRLGVYRATSFELQGVGASGPTRVLVVVGSSSFRTYAVTLLTPARPSAKRLAEVQQILATVRLTEPVTPKLPSKK